MEDTLDAAKKYEEETLETYDRNSYYPVKIGRILGKRYKVICKLGWGVNSTVWLCRDRSNGELRSVKVQVSRPRHIVVRELLEHERVSKAIELSSHPGRRLIQRIERSFRINSVAHYDRVHTCLVSKPLGSDMRTLLRIHGTMNEVVIKMALRVLLSALDFLHTEAKTIHTDIKADNIILDIGGPQQFEVMAESEQVSPSPQKKIDKNLTIYSSRSLNAVDGTVILCDLGQAVDGRQEHRYQEAQPRIYRAPEVVCGMSWGYPIDIWSVAMFAWRAFEGEYLFDSDSESFVKYRAEHLKQLVAIMGPPPEEFKQRIKAGVHHSQWRSIDICFNRYEAAPRKLLEEMEKWLQGESKIQFLAFMRRILRWLPEERPTARELLNDPWLQDGK